MNDELKTPSDKAMWDELDRLDTAIEPEHGQVEKIEFEVEEGCARELRPAYWLNLADQEPRLYYREDIYEQTMLEAYRNGRGFERHAQRFLVAAVGIFGLVGGAASVWVIFELVMR